MPNDTRPECSIPDCVKRVLARGWCSMHYCRWLSTGDPLGLKAPNGGARPLYGPPAPCNVPGCGKRRAGRGYCHKHWQKWKKYGDPLGRPEGWVVTFDDDTRTCRICEVRQPIEQFDRDRSATDGRRAQCKSCRGAKVADWYAANRERQRARAELRRAENIDKIREDDKARYYRDKPKRIALAEEYGNRRRAMLREAPSVKGITRSRLRKIHGDLCCYCGVVMTFGRATGHQFNPDQATIEHVIPLAAGGSHTWENVALACWSCNCRKNRKTPEEWERHKETQRGTGALGRLGDTADLDATA